VERTLVLLKPDAVQRRLVGRIISRFEDKGYKIAGMKLMRVTRELAERHYAAHHKKPFFREVRKLMGKTNPREASPGTIRGDYGLSITQNLVHGSDSPESAAREIPIFFSEGEIFDYSMADEPWLGG